MLFFHLRPFDHLCGPSRLVDRPDDLDRLAASVLRHKPTDRHRKSRESKVNALIYHVASGQSFFSGVVLIELAALSGYRAGRRWLTFWRTISACAGLILIAVSATPLPGWFYLVAVVPTLAWIGAEGSSRIWARVSKRWLRYAVHPIWLLGVALELPFHLMPTVPRLRDPQVYVVGDSISAGIGGETATWPKLLSERHQIIVRDLSRPGATVAGALRQAERLSEAPSLVVVEIGGNDVLGETEPETFERQLDALLARLRADGHIIVLLELPLPPFYNRFGAAQRRMARRHAALLVPKRLLLGVLTSEGATLDTVHLTRRGNALMARAIWAVIGRDFSPRGISGTRMGDHR